MSLELGWMLQGKPPRSKSIKKLMLLCFIAAFCFVSCSTAPKGRKASADWSRGIPFSSNATGVADMMVANDTVFTVWPSKLGDTTRLMFSQVTSNTVPADSMVTGIEATGLRTPRIAVVDHELRLFWLQREAGDAGWQLWSVRIETTGALLGESERLSLPEANIGSYTLAQRGDEAIILYEDKASKGIVELHVLDDVELNVAADVGQAPNLFIDAFGETHSVWLDEDVLMYANDSVEKSITNIDFGSGSQITDPIIGVIDDRVLVFWSIFRQTGLEAGTGYTEYISFDTDGNDVDASTRLKISNLEEPPTTAYENGFGLSNISPEPQSEFLVSSYIYEPSNVVVNGDELAVALSVRQKFRLDSQVQLATAFFSPAGFEGFTMAAKSELISENGRLSTDSNGYLHLIWREGAGGRDLYYATTEPNQRETIDAYSISDLGATAGVAISDMIVGILFYPLALIWLIPSLILLAIFRVRDIGEEYFTRDGQIATFVGIAVYQLVKFLFLPTMASYVPFSAWFDIASPTTETFLRIGTPLIIMGISFLIAKLIVRKKLDITSILFFMAFALIDILLTLAVYGVNLLGVF